MHGQAAPATQDSAPLGFKEFVALIACLMALTALGIDSMLPALPAIGAALDVAEENRRQFIITAFLIGFGVAQLAWGPLADRFGRKPVLTGAMVAYVLANLLATISGSFVLLLGARVLGGAAVAAARVVTVALVRDCYSGRAMARVMSLAFIVFMAAPVLAPMVGLALLQVGSWRLIFGFIAAASAAVLVWFVWRMPETLAVARRQPLSPERLLAGYRLTITDRWSLGYTVAAMLLLGGLYGFINSVQQIMFDVFHRPDLLIPFFACVGGAMACVNLLNSRLVMRLGTRMISHAALLGLIAVAALHLAIAWSGVENLWSFVVLQALMMGCFGLANSNFSAMAMENMGGIAGTASSVQGFATVTVGALIGAVIGQSFDGSTVPLYLGFTSVGVLALVVVLIAERGRLFHGHQA
ncbi:multidrug effflux MFS transporter [Sphingomonas aracearum]|uniref:Bcr/CflA family efflux transporter n=1 Tax=Sphingomonas aracearum TaxID=2283317 RepID=A0A369W182_9SPHN|nr:multidrug effflux MFS transporter [Sphingomonas aracearum]RDE07032.1 MFS transporter [Sphingomonas aracearum]